MTALSGIDSGKSRSHKKTFDLFRPISVKSDGRRVESANWCVRFQHQGKRTCRSLRTRDYRLATQRAKLLVASVRQRGWDNIAGSPTSHGSLSISDFLQRYQRSATSRGLRPISIRQVDGGLRRLAPIRPADGVSKGGRRTVCQKLLPRRKPVQGRSGPLIGLQTGCFSGSALKPMVGRTAPHAFGQRRFSRLTEP